jgi:hypothetical protein
MSHQNEALLGGGGFVTINDAWATSDVDESPESEEKW